MKRIIIHQPMFRILAPLISGVMVYLMIILLNNNVSQILVLFESQEVYVSIGLSLLFTESFRLLTHVSNHLSSKIGVQNPLYFQFVLSSLTTALLISIGLNLYFKFYVGYSPSMVDFQVFNAIFFLLNTLLNVVYFSVYYSRKENSIQLNNEKKKNEGVKMEMTNYKRDIDQVLLYQSLERLLVLIYEDVDKADEFIDELSSVYRYILGHKQIEIVSLETELKVVKSLINLLQQVYHTEIALEGGGHDKDMQLIPGALIGIIEQIVRDTIVVPDKPLVINMDFDSNNYLEIKYTLRDKLTTNSAEEKALIDSIQRAYNFFSDKPIVRIKAYHEGFYKIPMLALA